MEMSRIALCVIGRVENAYAVEFVEHYKGLGFDHIFVYDNNHEGEERFEDVLQPYIDEGYVTIIDRRDADKVQMKSYNDCYERFGGEYGWMAFFDFDEYLRIVDGSDIHSFMERFDKSDCVLVNWMDYTDGDLTTNDGRSLQERFTVPMAADKCVTYSFPENNHVKSIVRGGLRECVFGSNPHVPSTAMVCCGTDGRKCDQSPWHPYDHSTAYLKHFTTKTIEEWLSNKCRRGTGTCSGEKFARIHGDFFFKINNRTKEKEDFIERWRLTM